jgi:pyruvate dehydrogenase E2 component (dihydrolipoamide acetyltransferase)
MALEIKLPEMGENVEAGTVTKILVAVGDTVNAEQPLIEVETDKAVLEVPSPVNGAVTEIKIQEGAEVRTGEVILSVEESGASTAAPAEQKEEPAPAPASPPPEAPAEKAPAAPAAPAPTPAPLTPPPAPVKRDGGPVPAAPHVRGFAREIGIVISEVRGTGPGGRISINDIKDYSRAVNTSARTGQGSGLVAARPLPDFTRWGKVERQPLSGVRRRTAENLAAAWTAIPHVTQFEKCDITNLESLRKKYKGVIEASGGKLTMTAILVKVLATVLKKFPQFNTSIDLENGEIIYKDYFNIGLAVDTDRGLLVPVVKDVDQKSLAEVCANIVELATRARDKKLTIDEMQGGCFTISNLGGIAGTAFTPIVNAPEVAILGVSRSSIEPVYNESGAFEPRLMLPLSLSYDHRVIDGADGARFIQYLRNVLEEPFLLFLES